MARWPTWSVGRAAAGAVTAYLHTGWWPTFNLADLSIVIGGLLLAVAVWRGTDGRALTRGSAGPRTGRSWPPCRRAAGALLEGPASAWPVATRSACGSRSCKADCSSVLDAAEGGAS